MNLALVAATGFGTTVGTLGYRNLALRHGIIAHINSRTLHEHVVPRGGGIVIAMAFSIAMIALWVGGGVFTTMLLAVGGGGAAAVRRIPAGSGAADACHRHSGARVRSAVAD